MTYVVGLTGGIGSGKTTVSDRLKHLGATVADADLAARLIVEPGQPALKTISQHFGDQITLSDGTLNRAALRHIIFEDEIERKWLESVTHPAIISKCREILESAASEYAVLVLSAGTGRSPLMHRLLVVDVPRETQLERVMTRDNNSIEQVEAIINSQVPREARLEHADDIILNDGTLEDLYRNTDSYHQNYLALARKHR